MSGNRLLSMISLVVSGIDECRVAGQQPAPKTYFQSKTDACVPSATSWLTHVLLSHALQQVAGHCVTFRLDRHNTNFLSAKRIVSHSSTTPAPANTSSCFPHQMAPPTTARTDRSASCWRKRPSSQPISLENKRNRNLDTTIYQFGYIPVTVWIYNDPLGRPEGERKSAEANETVFH